VSISTDNKPELLFPATSGESACGGNVVRENPLTEGEVFVKIRSDYCNAWKNYINTAEPDVEVEEDDCETNDTITLKLITPGAPMFENAILATQKTYIRQQAKVSSYNSSLGQNCGDVNQQGRVRANQLISVESPQAEIRGDAYSAGTIRVSKGTITGNAYGGDVITELGGTITGEIVEGVTGTVPVIKKDGLIDTKIKKFSGNNDNNQIQASCPTGYPNPNELVWEPSPSATCTIPAGKYYLTRFVVGGSSGSVLEFDTSLGDIEIAFFGNEFDLGTSAGVKINVVGNNYVKIYIGSGANPTFRNNIEINANSGGRNTSRFQVWAHSYSGSITFDNNVLFYGFVHSPGNTATSTKCANPSDGIIVAQTARICGALVGGTVNICNAQWVYYDEALAGIETTPGAIIQYLHISENVLDVSIS
jgi:hypothetical protein